MRPATTSMDIDLAFELFIASWNDARTADNSESNTNLVQGELYCI